MGVQYKFITDSGKVKDLNKIYLDGVSRDNIGFYGENNVISNFVTWQQAFEIVSDSLSETYGDYIRENHINALIWLLDLDKDDHIALVTDHSDFYYHLEEGFFHFPEDGVIFIKRDIIEEENGAYEYDFIFDYENGITEQYFNIQKEIEKRSIPTYTGTHSCIYTTFNPQDFSKYWNTTFNPKVSQNIGIKNK